MAAGSTAPPIIMANSSHTLLDQESTVSSPLSEIMDGHEMDVDSDSDELQKPDRRGADTSANHPSHDSDSNLSEIETNDSEAETERLDVTPHKNKNGQSNITGAAESDQKLAADKNTRSFQRSPSKLQEQIRADVAAESESGDGDLDDDDEDKASDARSDTEGARFLTRASQSLRKKTQEAHAAASSIAAGNHSSDGSSADSRKRKRTPLPDHSKNDKQGRKSAGLAAEPGDETSSLSKTLSDDLEPIRSAAGKSDEEMQEVEDVAESVEKQPEEPPSRSKRSKRSSAKKRKGSEEAPAEDAHEAGDAAEEPPAAEDDHVEVDEEAQEAAHRNEEECKHHLLNLISPEDAFCDKANGCHTVERKRNAFEQLSSIEKHFAVLRDRLYEERLAQLNQEEAQLNCENPTHPEYLAMMQCIDSRRNERLRVNELEYKFNMDALDRWAVARRAQILSQFYQSIRESREKTLDELGKQWYEIQHERRKNANPIPDFGYRFPKTKALQKRQAIAHSKETSILAGIAQHHGFPAAPEMKGASHAEIDEDLEAIHVGYQTIYAAGAGIAN